jgi:hypothetical protein
MPSGLARLGPHHGQDDGPDDGATDAVCRIGSSSFAQFEDPFDLSTYLRRLRLAMSVAARAGHAFVIDTAASVVSQQCGDHRFDLCAGECGDAFVW